MLSNAREISGREDNFLVSNAPFAGLVGTHPVLAFRALVHAAKRNVFPEEPWREFLQSDARKTDKPRFIALIAERISRFPVKAVSTLLHPVSSWILVVSDILFAQFPAAANRLIATLTKSLHEHADQGATKVVRGNNAPDWAMEAINAPVGKIAQLLWKDPLVARLRADEKLSADWRVRLDDLLSLPGDLRRHALVILAHNLHWFHSIDPAWTEANLLVLVDGGDDANRDAFWDGFFWKGQTPDERLYSRLKSSLLKKAKVPSASRRSRTEALAGMLLAGWGSRFAVDGARLISDSEMREALLHAGDEFRSRVLWLIETWAKQTSDGTSPRNWRALIPEFISSAWPLQKSAKTPKTSAALLHLIFSDSATFPAMSALVTPLLTTVDDHQHVMLDAAGVKRELVSHFPNEMLSLMFAVLPLNAKDWPYGADGVLARISDADGSLLLDARLVELRRRWDSR